METLLKKFLNVGGFRWVFDEEDDPGFKVFGYLFIFYKHNDSVIVSRATENNHRLALKYGFGQ